MTLRNGGTVNLDSIGDLEQPQGGPVGIPGSYGQPAVDFLDWAASTTTTATKWQNGGAAGIPASFGLYQRLLFPAAEFGTDHVIPARNAARSPGSSRPPWPAGRRSSRARRTRTRRRPAILRVQTDERRLPRQRARTRR